MGAKLGYIDTSFEKYFSITELAVGTYTTIYENNESPYIAHNGTQYYWAATYPTNKIRR
ncbi:MAG TPA: hypothetical protein VIO64_22110 [Pseudobacteroides sp.]|uniref:hypothetical protein n=1 Tax=Pseudobacteroides sp. TaxID=1968840 RepID=UPI002F92C43C